MATEGCRVNKDIYYLNVILRKMRGGEIPNLSKDKLKDLGGRIEFYPGWINFIKESQNRIDENEEWKRHGIKIEHYIVTTGIADMVRGSEAAEYVHGI